MAELSDLRLADPGASPCCPPAAQADCCEPTEKPGCCSPESTDCGCSAAEGGDE